MAVIGFTAALSVNDGSSNAQQEIDQVTMITLPSQDTAVVEASYLGMTDPYKEFLPGLTDSGVLGFECNYSKATYNRLVALVGKQKHTTRIPASGTNVEWEITAPDEDAGGAGTAQTFTFNGILTKLEVNVEVEAVMKIKAEVKVNGKITVA
jgi:hypothetical protein